MTDAELIDCPAPELQLARLRAIMHRLRAPGGCPWDAEQTHESLLANLIEETYEAVDTIQRGDFPHLQEELGDVLLQVVFHSELAAEAGRFDLDDVARGICEKLVRRHPHVFANSDASTPEAVLQQWEEIKRAEKISAPAKQAFLHRCGHGLPALLRAVKLQKKAAKVGFDWPDTEGVFSKLHEELAELHDAHASGNAAAFDEELGDLLFSAVNLARFHQRDPELILAATNAKFENRFNRMEILLEAQGLTLDHATLDQMEDAWTQAKLAIAAGD